MVNEQRLVDSFLKLTKIDGLCGDEKAIADVLESELRELGFDCKRDDAGARINGSTGNLIAFKKGTVSGAVPITLNAHMDVVASVAGLTHKIENGVISSGGDTILGADDRAGIAVIMEALHVAKDEGIAHGDLQIIFSIGEEVGLYGAKFLDPKLVASKCVYVFDVGKPVGGITVSAPYHDNFTAVIHGKASHSGAEPEKGISAIIAASKAIANMTLGRIDFETTANVGLIKGGSAVNIIPDLCEVKGEARSRNEAKLDALTESIVKALNDAAAEVGAEISINVDRSYRGYLLTEEDQIVKIAMEADRRVGIEPRFIQGGGGSDANILNGKGIPAAPIGTGYEHCHTTNECIEIADLIKSAEVAVAMIQVAAEG